jgi:hypothetical protein
MHFSNHSTFYFRKIKSGVFPVPDYLNRSVVNLLCHMLQTGTVTLFITGTGPYFQFFFLLLRRYQPTLQHFLTYRDVTATHLIDEIIK